MPPFPKSRRTPDPLLADFTRYAQSARDAGIPEDQFLPYVDAGIVLQPKQLVASAYARSCDLPGGPTEIGYGGARGGGKSHWGLAQLAYDCLRYPGLTCLLLRKVGKANRENFEELRLKVLRCVGTRYRRQEGILLFENGSKIILGHFQNEGDIDAYLGLEYDVILVEEATTLTSAKYKAIRTCCRSSKPGWRPRMYSTTNPGGVGHAWYRALFIEPFRRGRETATRFIPATVDDNKCVNPEYRATLDSLTGWQLRAWRFGDWDIAAGQFFTNWREGVHVVKPFAIPAHWRKWGGFDYGYVHYTSFHALAKSEEGDLYIFGEWCASRRQVVQNADGIKAMLARNNVAVCDLRRIAAGHDAFSKKDEGPTIADRYKAEGLPMERAIIDRVNGAAEIYSRLGDPDCEDSAEKAALRPRLFVFDTCTRLIECLPSLEHDPHHPEDVLKVDADEDGLGGDDAYDSVRYGVMEDWKAPAVVTDAAITTALAPGAVDPPGAFVPPMSPARRPNPFSAR